MKIDAMTFLKAFLTVIVVVVICGLFYLLGLNTDVFSPFQQALDSYNITDLYMSFHKKQQVPSYDGASVVLMDISSCETREEIAEVIEKVNAAKPRMVAMDIIFPHAVSSDPVQDSMLTAALSNVENLVVATEMRPTSGTSYTQISSFFIDQTNAVEGLVSLPTGVIREWSPQMTIEGQQYPSLTKAIAEELEVPVPQTEEMQLINYAIYDPLVIGAQDSWDPGFLESQIVLMGDVYDARDTYQVPVSFRSSARQSGVYIHKQILMTCLAQNYFKHVPSWLEYLISVLILFVFSLVLSPLMERAKTMEDEIDDKFKRVPEQYTLKDCIKGYWFKHIAGTIQIGLIVVSLIIGYLLFWCGGYIYDLTFLLAGFVLLYASHQFVVALLKFISRITVIIRTRVERK